MPSERIFAVLKSLGGSGGSIIARILAANGALVLSEVNPRAAQLFAGALNPLVQMRRDYAHLIPKEWRQVDQYTLGVPAVFGRLMADLSDTLDLPLIIRDYSYIDYIGIPFIWPRPETPSLEFALKPLGMLRTVVIIRHPAAQYKSLLSHSLLRDVLSPADFVEGCIRFLRQTSEAMWIRYESFLEDPADTVASICDYFNIPYSPSWSERLKDAPALTGHPRAQGATELAGPPTDCAQADTTAKLRLVTDYAELLRVSGYK